MLKEKAVGPLRREPVHCSLRNKPGEIVVTTVISEEIGALATQAFDAPRTDTYRRDEHKQQKGTFIWISL